VVTTSKGNRYQRDLLLVIQSVIDDLFNKQPDDQVTFEVDFTRRLEAGDSLATIVATAIQESDGSDDSAGVLPYTEVISPKVGIRTAGGVDGETYRLSIQGTSAVGYVYEKFIRMNCQEF
jgi:hypothetical protein